MSELIRCSDPACISPVASIRGGVLVIVGRHHGGKHETRFTLVDLERLLAPQNAERVQ